MMNIIQKLQGNARENRLPYSVINKPEAKSYLGLFKIKLFL